MGSEQGASGPMSDGISFRRSASWSTSRTLAQDPSLEYSSCDNSSGYGSHRCFPLPHTPRSQSQKARLGLPPLSIARPSLDEWPKPGSDDLEEWPQPPTPSTKAETPKPVNGVKLELPSPCSIGRRDQMAFYDKECSKVADHIYFGGNYVARNREILRKHEITHILNCVGFVCPEYFKTDFVYRTLWLQDSPTEDITSILYDVFDYFEDVRQQDGRVFVHCCQGVSRSTSLVIAYLMWREGQSFDDAFQFVKAARGIANPNMGFACQLLQCQKRVHAIPLSPTSLLRMYRMAPHSPYDPLHLVPKILNYPSPAALDSRGAFIILALSSIYVWIGKNCESVMEKDAKAAAFQVVRYEQVQGPIMILKEGEESFQFWEALSNARLSEHDGGKVSEELMGSAAKMAVGGKRVESYDVDFGLFSKALTGGVMPPFSSSGNDQETQLPARENSWSILRHKFLSRDIFRVCSDSTLVRDKDQPSMRKQILAVGTLMSPSFQSPSSVSSDFISSKCNSESPSISPSTCYSPSPTLSPASHNFPSTFLSSSIHSFQHSSTVEPLKPCTESVSSLSKHLGSSIAERRGNFISLKLPTPNKGASLLSPKVSNSSSGNLDNDEKEFHDKIPRVDTIGCANSLEKKLHIDLDGPLNNTSESNKNVQMANLRSSDISIHGLTGSTGTRLDIMISTKLLVYRWPNLEKLTRISIEDFDSEEVLMILTSDTSQNQEYKVLFLWIGGHFEERNKSTLLKDDHCDTELAIDWHQVGRNFLDAIGLPKNLQIKVLKEHEDGELFELLKSA
ncbi:protein-tyrosine-phosphatase MKP1-like [Zingiber officinale]|uniref:Uncharacterized protein n=1 Tax=Zingiber officinale TaxID=94328 RepID=A0A8J5GE79_ZINOF|nr:protein-tyrosine-phosphatase MKP1-like [Zingiber officinale]XP_042394689.1 protein-tyrosine-phosphatase MKP1-like [Zingiber officinale]KAG6504541.1 hypothetical protein ZIOFF_036875 [Zingiber officinale]